MVILHIIEKDSMSKTNSSYILFLLMKYFIVLVDTHLIHISEVDTHFRMCTVQQPK